MNIKIQGGEKGTYANAGSCQGVVSYLQHEDLERIKAGEREEPFSTNTGILLVQKR